MRANIPGFSPALAALAASNDTPSSRNSARMPLPYS
jgi:hypothetical protein